MLERVEIEDRRADLDVDPIEIDDVIRTPPSRSRSG